MSKVSKSAGVRVPSTSGGGAARTPATQALSARTESQQALGPLRFSDLKFTSADALQASLDMLVQGASLRSTGNARLAELSRDAAATLQDHLEDLSMYLRQARGALADGPENSTTREILRLACGTGFQLVRQVAQLDLCATEMAQRLERLAAIGGVQ